MKKLITLRDYNLNKALFPKKYIPEPNGIECPKCKEELFDTNPGVVTEGIPLQTRIHCVKCGFLGYRLI